MKIKEMIKFKEEAKMSQKKIEDTIYDILLSSFDHNEYIEETEKIREDFILWENIDNGEFVFNYPFGNIDFDELIKINRKFKEEGIKISAIISNDIYKNKKGLDICFVKDDNEEEVRKDNNDR